jgi:hypothetical protein
MSPLGWTSRTAKKQDDDLSPLLEVDAIARAIMKLEFADALADRPGSPIAEPQPV